MPEVAVFQRSFAGGELAPSLSARAEQNKYVTGAAELTNMTIMRHGGAQSRPGFGYVATVKGSVTNAKLFSFIYNDAQSYALEIGYDAAYSTGFGDVTGSGYMRVCKDGAQLVHAPAAFATYSNASVAYAVGALVTHGVKRYYCTTAHTSSASLEPDDAAGAPYWYKLSDNPAVSGGSIVEIPAPYAAADIQWLYPKQSLDVIWFACRNPETLDDYPPYELRRTGHTAWEFRRMEFLPPIDGPTLGSITPTSGSVVLRYYVTATKKGDPHESLPGHSSTLVGPQTIASAGTADVVVTAVGHGLVTGDDLIVQTVGVLVEPPNPLLKLVLERSREELARLAGATVRLRVTLSYFIEPNPGRRGWAKRYSYQSHGLRFRVKSGAEQTLEEFKKSLSKAALDEEEAKPDHVPTSGWFVGDQASKRGSIHTNIWTGSAAELGERNVLAVYGVTGWWKEQKREQREAPYSLIVSIETEAVTEDIWTPVANQVGVPASVATEL